MADFLTCLLGVGIRRITEDRYGRTVAELFLGETNVQREMVATGHAEI